MAYYTSTRTVNTVGVVIIFSYIVKTYNLGKACTFSYGFHIKTGLILKMLRHMKEAGLFQLLLELNN